MRILYFIMVVCLVLTFGCAGMKPERDVLQDNIFHEYLNQRVEAGEFSGSVLIGRDGQIVMSRGYALANREHHIPNTPHTKFRLGSLTKQFTAMVILILQERGKLNVSDSVCVQLPDCPDSWLGVTLYHLLTHTSGIPSFTSFPDNLQHERLPTTTRKTVERFMDKPLEFHPGEKFRYSNSGYVLLGYIIELVTGQRYEEVVQELIFEPLGMHDSGYDHPRTILEHRAAGYSRAGKELMNAVHFEMDTPHAAGALYSTVEDLLKWDQALYGKRLVSEESLEQMHRPYRNGYAYGVGIANMEGRMSIAHGGGISGFKTHLLRFPKEKVCIIVLSNFAFANSDWIARKLAGMYFGELAYHDGIGKGEISPWSSHSKIKAEEAVKFTPSQYPATIKEVKFYTHNYSGAVKLFNVHGYEDCGGSPCSKKIFSSVNDQAADVGIGWVAVDVPDTTIEAGNFWISMEWQTTPLASKRGSNSHFLVHDANADHTDRNYWARNDRWSNLKFCSDCVAAGVGDLMITAVMEQ